MKKTAHLYQLIICVGLLAMLVVASSQQAQAARLKSKNPFAGSTYQKDREQKGPRALYIRFKDNSKIRLRKGRPYDLNRKHLRSKKDRAILDALSKGRWGRGFAVSEKKLDQMRKRASGRAGKSAPDLNLHFIYQIPKAMSMSRAITLIESLSSVGFVYPTPKYDIAVANYDSPQGFAVDGDPSTEVPWQKYLSSRSNGGFDAHYAWGQSGGDGAGVDIVDIEYAYNPSHHELAGVVTDFQDAAGNPTFDTTIQRRVDHGTATLGILAGVPDRSGITGIAHAANPYFVSAGIADVTFTQLLSDYCARLTNRTIPSCTDLPSAMIMPEVSGALDRGDVILIEMQMAGPNSSADWGQNNQFGAVPVEFSPIVFDTILTLNFLGLVVVEAAGNGQQNLDAPDYRQTAHQPFKVRNGVRLNDSGAIMVGAASSGTAWSSVAFLPGGTGVVTPAGIPRDYSNFGGRVDVHGWGDGVVTSGYGDLYDAEGEDQWYTDSYAGTSSASALIAGASASLQGMYKSNVARNASSGWAGTTRGTLYGPTVRRIFKSVGVDQTAIEELDPQIVRSLELSNRFNLNSANNIGQRPDLRAASDLLSIDVDDYAASCSSPDFPVPELSHPGGRLEREGNFTKIGVSFGDALVASYGGWMDIIYTVDGSEPDCWPRTAGSCDLQRVKAVTMAGEWRHDFQIILNNGQAQNTVRARFVNENCAIDDTPVVTRVYQ